MGVVVERWWGQKTPGTLAEAHSGPAARHSTRLVVSGGDGGSGGGGSGRRQRCGGLVIRDGQRAAMMLSAPSTNEFGVAMARDDGR